MGNSGCSVKRSQILDFLSFNNEMCPWFPEAGTVDIQMWEKVGKRLRDRYTAEGREKIPVPIFALWFSIRDSPDPPQERLRVFKQEMVTASLCESLKIPSPPSAPPPRPPPAAPRAAVKKPPDKHLPPKYEQELEFRAERDEHRRKRDDSDEKDFTRTFAKLTLTTEPSRLEAGAQPKVKGSSAQMLSPLQQTLKLTKLCLGGTLAAALKEAL